MGVFSSFVAGAADGVGRAASSYGAMEMREADLRDREAEERRREEARYTRSMDRQIEADTARADREAARDASRGTGGSGGSGKRGGGDSLLEALQVLGLQPGNKLLDVAGTVGGRQTVEESRDTGKMLRGEQIPDSTVTADQAGRTPDSYDRAVERDQTTMPVPKYEPGKAKEMMAQSWDGLARIMGILQTKGAEDAAKGTSIEHTTASADSYERSGGENTTAGNATLLRQNKGVFSSGGTSLVTGEAADDSVDESKIGENDANAKRLSASGGGGGGGKPAPMADKDKAKEEVAYAKLIEGAAATIRKSVRGMRMTEDQIQEQAIKNVGASRDAASGKNGGGGGGGDGGGGADKFTVGRVYKDANGNRSKYLGSGRWGPG